MLSIRSSVSSTIAEAYFSTKYIAKYLSLKEAVMPTNTSTKQKAIQATIITAKYTTDPQTIKPDVEYAIMPTKCESFSSTY